MYNPQKNEESHKEVPKSERQGADAFAAIVLIVLAVIAIAFWVGTQPPIDV